MSAVGMRRCSDGVGAELMIRYTVNWMTFPFGNDFLNIGSSVSNDILRKVERMYFANKESTCLDICKVQDNVWLVTDKKQNDKWVAVITPDDLFSRIRQEFV